MHHPRAGLNLVFKSKPQNHSEILILGPVNLVHKHLFTKTSTNIKTFYSY